MSQRSREWSKAVLAAVVIAWSFLAFFTYRLLSASASIAQHPVRKELTEAVKRDAALLGDFVAFFGAQVLIYTVLGLSACLLAFCTKRAFASMRRPLWLVSAGWALALIGFVYIVNAARYPWSAFGALHKLVSAPLVADVSFADALILGGAALAAAIIGRAALSVPAIRAQATRIAAYLAVALCTLAAMQALQLRPADERAAAAQPHVILIGVDSLRPDALSRRRGVGVTPNMDFFMDGAATFEDTTTPLARTFAAWMAVLSGQHPVRSGARDNLMPRAVLSRTETLADRLRAAGYATVYATDEVRFSNIDQSYGFDRVIGPKMGPSDFVLASWSDSPLTNLIVNSRLGRLLYPNSHANRGAPKTYRPEVFIDWLDRELDFSAPTLCAVHLTLPHYPYYWAENNDESFTRVSEDPYTYLASILAVDRQFGLLMESLERKGALDNAIVVLLSDHGEGLGLPSDNLVWEREAKAKLGAQLVSMKGHGSSVLSPHQYQVVLSVRRYGSAASMRGRSLEAPATLEDVAPTVLSLVGMPFDPAAFDGVSLAPALQGQEMNAERVRYTETGLTTTVMRMGNFGEAENVAEGLQFFEVDAQSSRIVFRRDRLGDLLAQKERAAFTTDWLLASVPDPEAGKLKYILVSRRGGVPEVVTHEPEGATHPEFIKLWTAMRTRFGAELQSARE